MAETRTVRTKFNPDLEIEVGPAEYTDLRRAGLLVETPAAGAESPADAPGPDIPDRVPYHARPDAEKSRKRTTSPAPAGDDTKES